ncbi:LPXTG cell wall anchor domain-containing protein [Edaphobacter aggregans]|uniref:LPXTG cell wall anchor domain-containing protein n=1 Tax=Edaphobacter aggregans TaxID=570835 RepID=UPI00055771C1|nr:LPXTG cell wall anchor domain-containing protein [Edaphobacter aggregans]
MAIAHWNIRSRWIVRAALCTFGCAMLSSGVRAQDTSSTTTQKGPAQYESVVKGGTVIYVSGNDVVVKMDGTGEVKHFTVPDSQTFTENGKTMNVHQLKVGTHLTQTVTTKTVPTTVKTVRTIDGKVWYVNPPSMVILTLPDGTNKEYKVPKGQMFNIDGTQQSVFHLKKGMTVSATVVTEAPTTVVTQQKLVAGVAPPPPPPPAQPMPDTVDVLLIETSNPAPQPTQTAAAEPTPAALPKTGSEWPLVGLLGLGSLAAGMLTRRIRMALK